MVSEYGNRIFQEQLRLVYSLLPLGLIATAVNGGVVAVLHSGLVPQPILLTWVLLQVLVTGGRAVACFRFRREGEAETRGLFWERVMYAGAGASGIVWGASASFMLFHTSTPHQILVAYVLGGMCAGSAGVFSTFRPTYLLFTVPALAPQILLFMLANGTVYMAMAGMLLFFWVLITFSAEANRRTTLTSFHLRFENEDLITSLSQAHDEAKSANLVLQAEIERRIEIEEKLRDAHEELERKVRKRTVDIINANARLQEVNRELSEFSHAVSHDLRGPLRVIDGFRMLLEDRYADKLDSRGMDYLNEIRGSISRMNELIDDLLMLSRVNETDLKRSPVDLSSLASSIAASLRMQEESRHVTFLIHPGMVAQCDPGLMHIVLENLLGNAWKYSGKADSARIEFGTLAESDRIVFFVRDNGVGFDMTHAGKLFAPFRRLHSAEEFPGTGLGLTTVRRIIHRHGGEIWATSVVDKGATFYFTLSSPHQSDSHSATPPPSTG